jgi:hydrogenase nickel incorporation protein HypA/HybF
VHELSLSRAIVRAVERNARGARVSAVSVRAGRLRQVVPDTLRFYFSFVSRGTVCEDAQLEVEVVDARLRCEACTHSWALESPSFRCPRCGGGEAGITSGDELEVVSIELEEAPCIARR